MSDYYDSVYGSVGDAKRLLDVEQYNRESNRGYLRPAGSSTMDSGTKLKLRATIDKLVREYVDEVIKSKTIDEAHGISQKYLKKCKDECQKAINTIKDEIRSYIASDETIGRGGTDNSAKRAIVKRYDDTMSSNLDRASASADSSVLDESMQFFAYGGHTYARNTRSGNFFRVEGRNYIPIKPASKDSAEEFAVENGIQGKIDQQRWIDLNMRKFAEGYTGTTFGTTVVVNNGTKDGRTLEGGEMRPVARK